MILNEPDGLKNIKSILKNLELYKTIYYFYLKFDIKGI